MCVTVQKQDNHALWALDSLALQQMYLSYVRPHVQYAVPVWDPNCQLHIVALERVQCFALRVCIKSCDSSYEDILTFYNLPSLIYVREDFICKLTFCIS